MLAYRTLSNPSGRILIFCNAGKQMPETLVVILRVFNSRIFSRYKAVLSLHFQLSAGPHESPPKYSGKVLL